MNRESDRFEYRPVVDIPAEFRQVDWTYIELRKKPFPEGERAFDRLRDELCSTFGSHPFLNLHFLRAIEDRLVMLAVETRQPISKCLEHLRRRMDLEYNRGEIYGKAAQALVLANYAEDLGERDLAVSLLKAEGEELRELAEICRSWLETVTQRIDELTAGDDRARNEGM